MNKRVSVFLAAFVILALSITALASPAAFDQKAVVRIDPARMMGHIEYLSVGIGPRVASSPEEAAGAEYIASTLASYGYAVQIQEFPYTNRVAYLDVLEPEGITVHVRVGTNSPLTPPGGVTGRVVDCGYGTAGEFPSDVAGNIALIRRGSVTFANMVANATAAGAVAVLIQNTDWRTFTASVTGAPIPFVTMNSEAGEALRVGDVVARLSIHQYSTSRNVIATRKPLNANHDSGGIVVFTAHHDSIPTAPGASDNASGVAALLELARVFANLPIGSEIRFVAVGAEEVGLRGSRYYVSQLAEDEKDRILGNYNMDMVGTAGEAQTTLYVNTIGGDNLVSRTAREAAQRLGYQDIVRAPYERGASDHVAFQEVGIDAANFIWRDPVTAALEPWYHQPYDTIDRISPERLRIAAEVVAAASYDVIRLQTPNLWVSRIRLLPEPAVIELSEETPVVLYQ